MLKSELIPEAMLNESSRLNFIYKHWRYGLAIVGGIVFPLSFSPFDLHLIIFLSIFLLLKALNEADIKTAFFVGWAFGLAVFGLGVGWIQISIHQFGVPYWLFSFGLTFLFVALMGLYYAILGMFISFIRIGSPLYIFAIPCLWFLNEYLRCNLFTGFPWLLAGYSQLEGPLSGFVPVIGSLGCSGLVVFVASIFLWASKSLRSRLLVSIVLIFGIFLSSVFLKDMNWTNSRERNFKVALIQGAIPQEIKWENSQLEETIRRYFDLSQDHWDKDIIIWPETALPIFPESVPDVIATLNKRGAETKTDLLVGAPTRDHLKKKYYNSLLQLGNSSDKYSKRNLVPYGEYFPGKSYFKFFEKYLMIPMSDLSPGSRLKDSFLLKGHQVGILICYEVAFTDVAFSSLPKSKILVNVSNDAWFGNSIAPFQHLQIARVRALESGRPLVRATNTGLTALIDHKGAVLEKAPQFVPAVVSGTIHARTGVTPYVEYRNVPALSLSIFVILFVLQNIFRRIIDLNH